MVRIYRPGDEKIDFIGVIELKSVWKRINTLEIQGTVHESITDSDLLLPIITNTMRLI